MNGDDFEQQIETRMYEPQKDTYDTIRLRLDPTPTLDLIRHSLLRERYNPRLEAWENPQDLRPMLSGEGIEDLMIDLTSRMSVDKVLGNITDRELNNLLREIGESILGFLVFNAEKYSIEEGDIERIFYICLHNVRIFLSRARGGLENIHITKQMQYREVKTARETGGQDQAGGMFGMFGGRK